jgi:iron complex outermembrane receptor protein
LSLGVQRAFCEKATIRPSGPLPVSQSSPWLFNGTLSIIASSNLVFYGGYTRGLEESPVAPDIAVNRGEAPPAITTEQMDAGLRLNLSRSLRLVAGVFDVRKPYSRSIPPASFVSSGKCATAGSRCRWPGRSRRGSASCWAASSLTRR